jgi:DUF1680 family protein
MVRQITCELCLFAAILGTPVIGSAGEGAPAPLFPPRCRPFHLRDVRLLDGPFKRSQDIHAAYLLSLDPDRLLSRFLVEAGLPAKAANYPGWEQKELPGVGASFYLSGCARLYATTGDHRFLERVNRIVDELDRCQRANGNGYLLATKDGKRIFAEIERGNIRLDGGWLVNGEPEPYYALEKLFSGLRDAWRVAGVRKALEIAVRLGQWLDHQMSHLSNEQMQKIMSCEFGGMNWVLADLYADTGDRRFLALSKRWDHEGILGPLSRGQDILPGKHANTQFPKISGLAARYPYSADPADRITAEFFWDRVVHHHSFVTGDNSTSEHFGPPDRLDGRLSAQTCENCNAWNMVRLTALLFALEPRAELGDFTERILWNHILAAQHPRDGRVCYFLPLESGHVKPYEGLYDRFACCTCSGFDSYARHGEAIYFHSPGELYVNLYIASELHWRDMDVTLRLETRLPDDDTVHLRLTMPSARRFKLALRCPVWATTKMTIAINGKAQDVVGEPGNFVVLDREWRGGDTVDLTMPLTTRIETMPDNPHRVALFKGPILLAGDLGPETAEQADDVPILIPDDRPLGDWLKTSPGEPLRFELAGVGRPRGVPLLPFFRVSDHRYVVYWDVLTPEQWATLKQDRDREQKRRKALESRTLDQVKIGDPSSEMSHGLKFERSNTGRGAYGSHMETHWRDAPDGWFSYELKVAPDRPGELLCTYWGKERGARTFDIQVNGQTIATTTLDSNHPAAFFDRTYPIPSVLTQGNARVTVKFLAHAQNIAGGLFGLRTLVSR